MPRCLLALGSNLGDRNSILESACAKVDQIEGCKLIARSCWHTTAPIGGDNHQDAFLNGAILVETSLQPAALALSLQAIEAQLGRQRTVRWDARTIDIDLLLYDNLVFDTPDLVIPHPRMAFRSFVLDPAAEIASQMVHPTSGWTLARLRDHLHTSPRYLTVTSAEPLLSSWLAAQLCQAFDCPSPKHDLPLRQQLPDAASGLPPVVGIFSPSDLELLASEKPTSVDNIRPALVIVLDPVDPKQLLTTAAEAGFAVESALTQTHSNYSGLGPLARITAEDPATVLQEALAAVRCVWSDIEAPKHEA